MSSKAWPPSSLRARLGSIFTSFLQHSWGQTAASPRISSQKWQFRAERVKNIAVAKTSTMTKSKSPNDYDRADHSRHSRLQKPVIVVSFEYPRLTLPTNLCLSLTPRTEIYLVSIPVFLLISCCPWEGYFISLKLWFLLSVQNTTHLINLMERNWVNLDKASCMYSSLRKFASFSLFFFKWMIYFIMKVSNFKTPARETH